MNSVRVQFEIGHEASVRTKKTPDGFTHDWEVFVKGADNTDIQYFVDKVVFHLHETFPKPRRVIKEPPYAVKESGYAGFVLPIDVYLKNKEEPKKISFQYDLTLQTSGPPISRVLREPRVFQNPSEDFRRKLIRGGGVGVDTPSEVQMEEHKASSLGLSKLKTTESPSRKYKPDMKLNDSFAEVFGTPIRRITPEPKKVSDLGRRFPDSDRDKKKFSRSYKEDKELPKEKEKYSDREKAKERDKLEKMKEKALKLQLPPVQTVTLKPKEEHKKYEDKDRKKEEYDEKKKRKEERDKKEKHKEVKDPVRVQIEKEIRKDRKESRDSDYLKRLNSSKLHENRVPMEKSISETIEKEKDRLEKEKHKHRHKKKEKEKDREKEKYKKEKDKSKEKDKVDYDSRERNREREKLLKKRPDEIKDREDRIRKRSPSPPEPAKMRKGPLNALLVELGSSGSASPLSEDDDSIPSFKSIAKTPIKTVPVENKLQSTVVLSPKLKSTNLNLSLESRKDAEKHHKSDDIGKNRRERSPSRKNKRNDVDSEKRKSRDHRRTSVSSEKDREDENIERHKRDKDEMDALFGKEHSEKEDKSKQNRKDKESSRKRKREKGSESSAKMRKCSTFENNVAASQSAGADGMNSVEVKRSEKFTKEYVAQLRDLQHRIMTLEDNDYLQKVVEVIAETGQYEITKKTFDFDLCALDMETIRRLQEFFSPA